MREVEGVEIGRVSDRTFLMHLGGKLRIESKVPIRNRDDLSLIYTPGVARVCLAIAENPEDARRLTIKRNTVAVVTDGTAVLGLGNIGPLAALPVMEGKAALFKRFADIDAFPICLDTTDTEEIIRTVKAISPVFAGINLEDISAPRCFEIEAPAARGARHPRLPRRPARHGDRRARGPAQRAARRRQAARGRPPRHERRRRGGHRHPQAASSRPGRGTSSSPTSTGSCTAGAPTSLSGEHPNHAWIAEHTNPDGRHRHAAPTRCAGADVFLGVSAPNILTGDDIASMAPDSVVFAMANPEPEIDPVIAARHAAVVATGRSDFANQINNVLVFPGVFRGLHRLRRLARRPPTCCSPRPTRSPAVVHEDERNATYIIPSVFHPDVSTVVAEAVKAAVAAREPA